MLRGSVGTMITSLPTYPGAHIALIVLIFLLSPFTAALPLFRRSAENVDQTQSFGNIEKLFQADTSTSGAGSTLAHRIRHQHLQRQQNRLKDAFVYLRKFGYLEEKQASNSENVEEALKAFQQMAGIKESGKLTKKTSEKMKLARCGNEDIESPVRLSKFKKRFAQVSKWSDKMDQSDVLRLKWFIEKSTKDIPLRDIRDVVTRAFKLWSSQSAMPAMRTVKLDFSEAAKDPESDISIMWTEGEHGDAYPFDGPGNTTNILAHTFYPNYQETGSLNGNIHFDDYEKWVLDDAPSDSGVHFPYVLVHEIGHALGLGHSKRQEAVMNPIYKQTPLDSIVLDIDDKCAVNWNYIGPSNTCLFVWLMVELLPRVKETNSTHGIAPPPSSGKSSDLPHGVGEQSIDRRINQTLDNLEISHIPLCSDSNDVQEQYEDVLVKKLDFPRDSARRYGPVVCNYLAGLSNVVRQRKRTVGYFDNSPNDAAARSSGPLKITVHSYPTSPYGELQYSEFHDSSYQSLNEVSQEDARNTLSQIQRQNESTIFSRNFYDEKFFKNVLRLIVTKFA